jgi:hypothetical protein
MSRLVVKEIFSTTGAILTNESKMVEIKFIGFIAEKIGSRGMNVSSYCAKKILIVFKASSYVKNSL